MNLNELSEPSDLFDPLIAEINRTLKEISETEDIGKRQKQSEVLKNLCGSLGIFLEMIGNVMDLNFPEFMYDDDA